MKALKIKVTDTCVKIVEKPDKIPSGNVEYIKCEFDIDSAFDNLVMRASFNGEYRTIVNGICFAPLLEEGDCKIGVYGYTLEDGKYKLVISPQPARMIVSEGSYNPNDVTANNPNISEIETFYKQIEELIKSNGNLSDNETDYTELTNIPRKLVYDSVADFNQKGIYEFMNTVTLRLFGDDEGNKTEHQIQAEKGAILLSSGNFGNEHNKILITARDIYCEQYRDMEYHFDSLSSIVYTLSGLDYSLSEFFVQQSEFAESVNNAIAQLSSDISSFDEKFTQEQSKTEQRFTTVNHSIKTLSESVNQEYLSNVNIDDVRIYVDENGNNKFTFDNNTLEVISQGGNSYISDYIPITEKLQVTGFSVQNNNASNGIAFVTYDENKKPLQAYRGNEKIEDFAWKNTSVLTPDDAAFVRLRSRDSWKNTPILYATVKHFISTKEKIEEMQAQIDSLLSLTTAEYAVES